MMSTVGAGSMWILIAMSCYISSIRAVICRPCMNNGRINRSNIFMWCNCICSEGFTGSQCQFRIQGRKRSQTSPFDVNRFYDFSNGGQMGHFQSNTVNSLSDESYSGVNHRQPTFNYDKLYPGLRESLYPHPEGNDLGGERLDDGYSKVAKNGDLFNRIYERVFNRDRQLPESNLNTPNYPFNGYPNYLDSARRFRNPSSRLRRLRSMLEARIRLNSLLVNNENMRLDKLSEGKRFEVPLHPMFSGNVGEDFISKPASRISVVEFPGPPGSSDISVVLLSPPGRQINRQDLGNFMKTYGSWNPQLKPNANRVPKRALVRKPFPKTIPQQAPGLESGTTYIDSNSVNKKQDTSNGHGNLIRHKSNRGVIRPSKFIDKDENDVLKNLARKYDYL